MWRQYSSFLALFLDWQWSFESPLCLAACLDVYSVVQCMQSVFKSFFSPNTTTCWAQKEQVWTRQGTLQRALQKDVWNALSGWAIFIHCWFKNMDQDGLKFSFRGIKHQYFNAFVLKTSWNAVLEGGGGGLCMMVGVSCSGRAWWGGTLGEEVQEEAGSRGARGVRVRRAGGWRRGGGAGQRGSTWREGGDRGEEVWRGWWERRERAPSPCWQAQVNI